MDLSVKPRGAVQRFRLTCFKVPQLGVHPVRRGHHIGVIGVIALVKDRSTFSLIHTGVDAEGEVLVPVSSRTKTPGLRFPWLTGDERACSTLTEGERDGNLWW